MVSYTYSAVSFVQIPSSLLTKLCKAHANKRLPVELGYIYNTYISIVNNYLSGHFSLITEINESNNNLYSLKQITQNHNIDITAFIESADLFLFFFSLNTENRNQKNKRTAQSIFRQCFIWKLFLLELVADIWIHVQLPPNLKNSWTTIKGGKINSISNKLAYLEETLQYHKWMLFTHSDQTNKQNV